MTDLLSILFPEKCAVCGIRTGNRVLCEECEKKLSALKSPDYDEPSNYFNVKADCVVWLYEYRDGVAKDLIYSYKYRHNPALARMLAGLLCDRITGAKTLPAPNDKNAVITFVPRSGRNVSRYGFDQARLLAKTLSKKMKIKFMPLFSHTGGGRDQKTLTRAERIRSAPSSYKLRRKLLTKNGRGVDLRGKTVFLIDDVITTGASVNACVNRLKGSGAEKIVAVCIAKVR